MVADLIVARELQREQEEWLALELLQDLMGLTGAEAFHQILPPPADGLH